MGSIMDSIDIVLFIEGHAWPPPSPKPGTQWSEYHSRRGAFHVFEFIKEDGWVRIDNRVDF